MDWDILAWLKRGNRRKSVLVYISRSKNPVSANDIKKPLKIAISQSSATLKELYSLKLVKCLNPQDKIGKLYTITAEGKRYLGRL